MRFVPANKASLREKNIADWFEPRTSLVIGFPHQIVRVTSYVRHRGDAAELKGDEEVGWHAIRACAVYDDKWHLLAFLERALCCLHSQ